MSSWDTRVIQSQYRMKVSLCITVTLNLVSAFFLSFSFFILNPISTYVCVCVFGAGPKVGSKDDQKADNHMRTLIKDVLKDKKRALQNTLLITNDNGFSEEIDSLREAGHTVLLATTQESFIITSRAHETWSWKHDFVQVHP